MGRDNQDQNTIRPYKGASQGEDWDTYVVQMMKQFEEMQEPPDKITNRLWGEYEVIGQGKKWKGKILRINPGQAISLQRHFKREERWIVVEGEGEVWVWEPTLEGEGEVWVKEAFLHKKLEPLQPGAVVEIAKKEYHWLHNTSSSTQLIIIEAWLGEELSESDIERVNYDAASVFIEK